MVTLNPVLGDHVYVSAPLAFKVSGLPAHTTEAVAVTETVGKELTETVTVCVFTQPFEFVPVIVYVVATVGLADTIAPVVALRLVFGDHTYVIAPLAVTETELPEHTVAGEGVIVKVGNEFTVTETVLVFTQPLEFVPVTVYVSDELGLAFTAAPVVTLSPVLGDHT